MKLHSNILIIVMALLVAMPAVTRAEPPKIEHIIELLQKAKDSDKPVPLLEEAHKILKEFKPEPNGNKATAAGIHARHQAGNAVAAEEHKHQAMKALNEAIEVAKNGGDAKSKIESAVAYVHQAGELKH